MCLYEYDEEKTARVRQGRGQDGTAEAIISAITIAK